MSIAPFNSPALWVNYSALWAEVLAAGAGAGGAGVTGVGIHGRVHVLTLYTGGFDRHLLLWDPSAAAGLG